MTQNRTSANAASQSNAGDNELRGDKLGRTRATIPNSRQQDEDRQKRHRPPEGSLWIRPATVPTEGKQALRR